LSIGFTFDHGTVSLGPGATADLPPPRRAWFEQPLGDVRLAQYALDLRGPAPRSVREWMRHPIETRGLADSGPGGYMTGGSLAQWFDLIVHRQTVSPSAPP
jgi:Erythromycin esterase